MNIEQSQSQLESASDLGAVVRTQRRELKLTLSDLAERSGLAKGYLSMLENSRLSNPPSREALGRIEQSLDLASGTLQRLADWQRTPASVREQAKRLQDQQQRVEDLAAWLRDKTAPRDGGGRTLDRLYRSGQLRKRIETAMGTSDSPDQAGDKAASKSPIVGLGGRQSVPLINKVSAGYPSDFTDLDYPARVADAYVPNPPGVEDPDVFAAYVHGDSMSPRYEQGDVVVFSPMLDVISGCDCFVRFEQTQETTFKRVYFEQADTEQDGALPRIRLQPLNPKYPARVVEREEVAGLYRAVWRMSKL